MESYPPMKLVSFFLEILPLAGFFLGYEFYGLFVAAVISVVLGALVMALNWIQTRRLARFALFSLLLSGGMTLAALYLMQLFLLRSSQPCLMVFLLLCCLAAYCLGAP